jgi:hypothetical protein
MLIFVRKRARLKITRFRGKKKGLFFVERAPL